jgi:hypothetical protein
MTSPEASATESVVSVAESAESLAPVVSLVSADESKVSAPVAESAGGFDDEEQAQTATRTKEQWRVFM